MSRYRGDYFMSASCCCNFGYHLVFPQSTISRGSATTVACDGRARGNKKILGTMILLMTPNYLLVIRSFDFLITIGLPDPSVNEVLGLHGSSSSFAWDIDVIPNRDREADLMRLIPTSVILIASSINTDKLCWSYPVIEKNAGVGVVHRHSILCFILSRKMQS